MNRHSLLSLFKSRAMSSSNTKTVYFIRHAESTFNLAHHSREPVGSADFIDAPLSTKGEQQAKDAKRKIPSKEIDLVISSPYRRAIFTCFLAFGNKDILLTPLCGERFEAICDIGTPRDKLVQEFPGLDFSNIQDDIWWFAENPGELMDPDSFHKWFHSSSRRTESDEQLRTRAKEFYQFLVARPEKTIAVFSHSHFLRKFLHWHFGRDELYIGNADVIRLELKPVSQCDHL